LPLRLFYQALMTSILNLLTFPSHDITPNNLKPQNARNISNRNQKTFSFFQGFGQLSCSFLRHAMTVQNPSHKSGFAVDTGLKYEKNTNLKLK